MKSMQNLKINYLTYIFILLLLFSGYKDNLGWILLVFFIHEIGHFFFCKIFKIKIVSINIYPFGGIIKLDKLLNYSIVKEFLIAFGGIFFQLILQFINIIFIKSSALSFYNLLVLKWNVIPIIPLDGSKILQIFFSKVFPYYASLILTYVISFVFVIAIIFFSGNFGLAVFSLGFLIKYIFDLSYVFNRFLLERYLYKFTYKKYKYLNVFDPKKICLDRGYYFYENTWKEEKYFLGKKFDKNQEFW